MRLVADNADRLEWCMKHLGVPERFWRMSVPAVYDAMDDYGIRTSFTVVYDWKEKYGK